MGIQFDAPSIDVRLVWCNGSRTTWSQIISISQRYSRTRSLGRSSTTRHSPSSALVCCATSESRKRSSLLVPTPDPALCREIADLLETHNAVEEGRSGVYEECEALLGTGDSAALLARA